MYIKILLLLNLIGFAFVVSQPFFYLLALSNAQKSLDAPSYIELRKQLDKNLQVTLRLVYYITLISALMLTLFTFSFTLSLLFISSLIALCALLTDIVLAFTGDIPLNNIINTWNATSYPRHWKLVRKKWFYFFHLRQLVTIIGFISLLIGVVFG